jgi:hypothetical protein
LSQEDIPEVFGVSFYLCIGGWKVVPVNRDEPVGSEVGFPLVLDHFLHHLSKRVGFGLDSLEFSVEGGSGGVM